MVVSPTLEALVYALQLWSQHVEHRHLFIEWPKLQSSGHIQG